MPGILPMKVIKVGTSAQSRIAQACDRCRSKKIRCDGVTPCCSQCENVGFECKTSDKLSRRAFPRGYTESLEERVRSLESEVKELKDLLDGKDEKIDLLTRVYSQSPPARPPSSTFSASTCVTSRTSSISAENVKDDSLKRTSSATSQVSEADNQNNSEASTGRPFIDAFKKKLESIGHQRSSLKTDAFYPESADNTNHPSSLTHHSSWAPKIPSRMASDQMINIFLQEWSPLFPILHRQATLKEYTEFVADPEGLDDHHTIAKLYLIFCIGAISAEWNQHDSKDFEAQWITSLDNIKKDVSVPTLQCLLLAQIYCIAKRDLPSLKRYKSAAIQMSQQLALHQSQNRSSLGPLATEARKRIFWTLYTIDCFSAAILGEPRAVLEDEIRCEYPQDVDDENIVDDGFLPTLPGESTRVSSALALFRGARVFASVLDEVYPAKPSYQLSFRRLAELNEDLDSWLSDLPSHLRLQFVQDKPSTNVVGSRSPFLSLTYHHIRALIHRPSTTCTTHRASTSIVALAESSKHIIQILQLLDERRMSFSICLNKDHVLTMAGFGLLFQTISLDRKGKLIQDTERLLCSVISTLEKNEAPGASDFKEITCAMISVQPPSKAARPAAEDHSTQRQRDQSMPAPKSTTKLCRKIKNPITRNSSSNSPPVKIERDTGRISIAPLASQHLPYQHKRDDGPSQVQQFASEAAISRTQAAAPCHRPSESSILPNLDYLDFGDEPRTEPDGSITKSRRHKVSTEHAKAEREAPQIQPLDPVFPSPDVFSYMAGSPTSNNTFDWCTDFWNMSGDLNDQGAPTALSFIEEDLASSEGYSSSDRSGGMSSGNMSQGNGSVVVDGLDGDFGL